MILQPEENDHNQDGLEHNDLTNYTVIFYGNINQQFCFVTYPSFLAKLTKQWEKPHFKNHIILLNLSQYPSNSQLQLTEIGLNVFFNKIGKLKPFFYSQSENQFLIHIYSASQPPKLLITLLATYLRTIFLPMIPEISYIIAGCGKLKISTENYMKIIGKPFPFPHFGALTCRVKVVSTFLFLNLLSTSYVAFSSL